MSYITLDSIDKAHDQFINDMNGPKPEQRCYGRIMRDVMPVLHRELERAKDEEPEGAKVIVLAIGPAVAAQLITVVCSTATPEARAELADHILAFLNKQVPAAVASAVEAGHDQ
jgi:hypothetical protein